MRFSPDGLYYWDGVQWVSTISHDGRSRWDGAQWVPLQQQPAYVPAGEHRPSREPTSWTRPLQIGVIAYYVLAAIYAVTLPFTMGGVVSQIYNQPLQQQQSLYATPPPVDFAPVMNAMFTYVFAATALFAFAISVVAILGTLKRWVWAFYAILVLLGLGMLGTLYNVASLAISAVMAHYGVIGLPLWLYAVGIVAGLINTALFVWMLVALIKRGPWAMTRVQG